MSIEDREVSPVGVIVALLLVTVAIVTGAVLLLATRPEPVQIVVNPPIPTATSAPSATPRPVLVYVTGAVTNPETTLELPHGSRVQDAVDAAGGLVPGADLERVNLAGIVRDGDHIHVYTEGEAVGDVVQPTPGGGDVVYINTATVEELDTLPGIGPAIAARIIEYRETNGPFSSFDDLQNVSGVGPAMVEGLQDLVSFE